MLEVLTLLVWLRHQLLLRSFVAHFCSRLVRYRCTYVVKRWGQSDVQGMGTKHKDGNTVSRRLEPPLWSNVPKQLSPLSVSLTREPALVQSGVKNATGLYKCTTLETHSPTVAVGVQ
jgi:hypothetical protein